MGRGRGQLEVGNVRRRDYVDDALAIVALVAPARASSDELRLEFATAVRAGLSPRSLVAGEFDAAWSDDADAFVARVARGVRLPEKRGRFGRRIQREAVLDLADWENLVAREWSHLLRWQVRDWAAWLTEAFLAHGAVRTTRAQRRRVRGATVDGRDYAKTLFYI